MTGSGGAPAEGLVLSAQPSMTMGHGSSVVPTVAPRAGGIYELTNVVFTMPGNWQLRIDVSGPTTDHVQAVFEIP